jgi:hypothetical protein
MPCRDDYPPDYGQDQKNKKLYGLSVNDFSLLAAVACEACENLTAADAPMSPLVKKWWEAHQKEDADRVKNASKAQKREVAEKEASEFLKKRLKELGVE